MPRRAVDSLRSIVSPGAFSVRVMVPDNLRLEGKDEPQYPWRPCPHLSLFVPSLEAGAYSTSRHCTYLQYLQTHCTFPEKGFRSDTPCLSIPSLRLHRGQ